MALKIGIAQSIILGGVFALVRMDAVPVAPLGMCLLWILTSRRRLEEADGKHRMIVAMTARAMKGDRERCLQHGMDDYIAKPIQFRELSKILAKLELVASGVQLAVK